MKKIKAIGFDPELQEPVDLHWDGGFYVYETKVKNKYGDNMLALRFTPSFQESFHHFYCKTSRFYKDEDIYSDSYCKLLGECYSFEKAREFIQNFSKEAYIVKKVDYCEYYNLEEVDFSKLDFSDLEDIVVFREDYREIPFKEEDLQKDNFYKLGVKLGFIQKKAEDNLLSINISMMVELYSNQDVAHYVNELNSIIFGKEKAFDLNKFSTLIQEKRLDKIDTITVVTRKDYENYDLFSRVCNTFNFFYELSTFEV